ncbi:MAG: hypothetical protein M3P04_14815 [Actinomycetota bacterium]|nr:hypothetical protein [Actinomycetota bacterium]
MIATGVAREVGEGDGVRTGGGVRVVAGVTTCNGVADGVGALATRGLSELHAVSTSTAPRKHTALTPPTLARA